MIVVGAGMAGLLAAAMLRKECTAVYEAQPALPNNHSAVLRFRTLAVSDALNIPFKTVQVMKATHPWKNPVADAMAYSQKTNRSLRLRSITSATSEISTRFIAPEDLISRMAACVTADIVFAHKFDFEAQRDSPIISTIPMPQLMRALEWPDPPPFPSVSGKNVVCKIRGLDTYASLYVPSPYLPAARISLSGNVIIVECPNAKDNLDADKVAAESTELVGISPSMIESVEVVEQRYAKILPINENVRKRFLVWATETHNVYSLGRYATWRPGLLLDDVVNDVRVIGKMIRSGTTYDGRK